MIIKKKSYSILKNIYMKINLSISHLGWRKDENKNVIKILKKNKIKDFLKSDYYIIFGCSFIKGPL